MEITLDDCFERRFSGLLQANPKRIEILVEHKASFFARHPTGLKFCTPCGKDHGLEFFRVKDPSRGLLKARCIEADLQLSRQWYEKNRDSSLDRARINKQRSVSRNRQYLKAFLSNQRCSQCGCAEAKGGRLHPCLAVDSPAQSVWMAVQAGLSLESVDVALARSSILCEQCLGERGAQVLADHRSLISGLQRSPVRAPHFHLRSGDTYQQYRRVNVRSSWPLPTRGQQSLQRKIAKKLRKSEEIFLTGDFEYFEWSLMESIRVESSPKRRKRLLDLLHCLPASVAV